MKQALDALRDPSTAPRRRLEEYRDLLGSARLLLEESLRVQPGQARAISRLAAVRWELDPPLGEAQQSSFTEMVRIASEMAPEVPEVQLRLGELLLKMGRPREGLEYLARSARLAPRTSARAVQAMSDAYFTPQEMLEALPAQPSTLSHLREPFRLEGALDEWLDAAEPHLAGGDVLLMRHYGATCLEEGAAGRLRATMESLSFAGQPVPEAERLRQLALGLEREGEIERALQAARSAAALLRHDPDLLETLADVLWSSGDGDEAIVQYRAALAALARRSARKPVRARVYLKIGRIRDLQGRPDLAYDSYRKVLEIDPEHAWVRRRLTKMREDAGFD
jgi:tetratricopeptide (TPR) repeat protein